MSRIHRRTVSWCLGSLCCLAALGCSDGKNGAEGGDAAGSPSSGAGAASSTGASSASGGTGNGSTGSGPIGPGVGWNRASDQWWDRLESAGAATFTLVRDSADAALDVTWETADGTATGGDTCGGAVDYVRVGSGQAHFDAGQTATDVTVTLCHNGSFGEEAHEDFVLRVVAAGDEPIVQPEARAVVIDEDGHKHFNSSEPGCGTDPAVVWCDDFEDQIAWNTDCDGNDDFGQSGLGFGPDQPGNDGFCGTLLAFTGGLPENPSRIRCGEPGALTGGAAGTRCAMDFGPHQNGSDAGMAFKGFAAPTEGTHEAWFRFYWTAEPGTKFIGNSKGPWYPHPWQEDGAGITWGGLAMGNAGWGCPMTDTEVGICPGANACEFGAGGCVEDGIDLVYMRPNQPSAHPGTALLGRWTYIEIYMRLNDPGVRNGRLHMWMADCGEDGRGCPPGSEELVMQYDALWWFDGEVFSEQGPIGSVWLEQWDNSGDQTIGGRAYIDQWKVSYSGKIGPMVIQ